MQFASLSHRPAHTALSQSRLGTAAAIGLTLLLLSFGHAALAQSYFVYYAGQANASAPSAPPDNKDTNFSFPETQQTSYVSPVLTVNVANADGAATSTTHGTASLGALHA